MPRHVILFGNGLGRAIDNDFFSLERVLKSSWENDAILNDDQRKLICACLEDGLVEKELVAPTSESELSNLKRVLDACDTIREFETEEEGDERWLTQHGNSFPVAIRRYFHHAASLFHEGGKVLPPSFTKPLREFICDSGPDIVTLNYDDLLYEAFTGTEVFTEHFLRDGFFGGNLDMARHENWFAPEREGWFLHLHGSPLFVTRNGEPKKITRAELSKYVGENSFHIVLTNTDSKPSVIENSSILKLYWEKLDALLRDAEKVSLFGYGGKDLHLNRLIGLNNTAVLRVITRANGKTKSEVNTEWRTTLRVVEDQRLEVVLLNNLIEFSDW